MKKKAEINRDNISRHLIEYQLNMVGKNLINTLDDDKWYFNWTITQDQHEIFKKYAITTIKKIFKCNNNKAIQTFNFFNLQFGLRIKN